jgi:rhodanese-related sulfurtransferase
LEFIQQNLLLVLLAVGSGAALLFTSLRRPGGRNGVTSTQATLLINRENAVVVDVRATDEYVAGHLPESRNIPLDQLEARVSELDSKKEAPLILVCQTGARSAGACKQLEKLGFARVSNLEGGIAGWRSAGLPLKKGAKK